MIGRKNACIIRRIVIKWIRFMRSEKELLKKNRTVI